MGCFGRKKRVRRETRHEQSTATDNYNANKTENDNASRRPASSSQVSPNLSGSIQFNADPKLHESCINTLRARDAEVHNLEIKVHNLEEEIKDNKKRTEEMKKRHYRTLEEAEIKNCHTLDKLSRQTAKVQELTEANESLLTRISAIASAKLTDGNANIADLSDQNRPTKLAEKYSELYDNEWTDAFEVLIKSGETEENTCLILLKALCTTYIVCRDKASEDFKFMTEGLKIYLGTQNVSAELLKPLKDCRKKTFKGHEKSLKKSLRSHIKKILSVKETRTDPKVKPFLEKCIELCWLMVIQDPSVFMDVTIQQNGAKYESDVMKPYTMSGKYIDYIVWPPIYLQKDGNVLCKGICQCKKDENINQTVYDPQEGESEGQQTEPSTFQKKEENNAKQTDETNTGIQPSPPLQSPDEIIEFISMHHDENTKANILQKENRQTITIPGQCNPNFQLKHGSVSSIPKQPTKEITNTITATNDKPRKAGTIKMQTSKQNETTYTFTNDTLAPKRGKRAVYSLSKSMDYNSLDHSNRNLQTTQAMSLI